MQEHYGLPTSSSASNTTGGILDAFLRSVGICDTAVTSASHPAACNYIFPNHWRPQSQATTPVLIDKSRQRWLLLMGDNRTLFLLVALFVLVLSSVMVL